MTVFVDDDGKAYQFYSSENATMHVSLLDGRFASGGEVCAHFEKTGAWINPQCSRAGEVLFDRSTMAWDPNAARLATANKNSDHGPNWATHVLAPMPTRHFTMQGTSVLPVQGA